MTISWAAFRRYWTGRRIATAILTASVFPLFGGPHSLLAWGAFVTCAGVLLFPDDGEGT